MGAAADGADDGRRGRAARDANLPSFADTLRRTLAALDAAPDVANRERLSARRRALATLACNQRRLSTWGDAEVSEICAELEATISQLGPKAQDSLAALLALKIAAPTPNERSPLPPGAAERWCRRWEEDYAAAEASGPRRLAPLLCRARGTPAGGSYGGRRSRRASSRS